MASRGYTRSLLQTSMFHTSGSAPVIAHSPSSTRDHFPGSLPHQTYVHLPWRTVKPYAESYQRPSRNRRTEKPIRPPLPSSVIRAVSAENQQHLNSWSSSRPNSSRAPDEPEEQLSSEISLCSSLGNTVNFGASPTQAQRTPDFAMHYGQPHAYALYDFDTAVEGDLQFRAGDLIMLEDVVNEEWYRGHSVRTGQVGIFPMNHVEVKVPVPSGLYTNAQPKPRIRTVSEARDANKKTPTVKTIDSLNNAKAENHTEKVLRDDMSKKRSSFPYGPAHAPVLRRAQTQHQSFSPTFTANTAPSPTEPVDGHSSEKSEASSIPPSSTPSVVTSIRPRSQTSVYQMAQHLEQRGVTVNRMKTMPPGGRAIFPSSLSPRSGASPVAQEQPKSYPDFAASEGSGKSLVAPSPHMVATPLALIAREQNRILGKGKLAPTEAYPTTTSSDPALAKSAATTDRQFTKPPKIGNGVMVSTKSEIDLSSKPNQPCDSFTELTIPVTQSNGTYTSAAFTKKKTNTEAVPLEYHTSGSNKYVKNHSYMNKPVNYNKPVFQYSSSEVPPVLRSREATLVYDDQQHQEEQNVAYGEWVVQADSCKRQESSKMDIYSADTPNVPQNTLATAVASVELKASTPTYTTNMTQELSRGNTSHQSTNRSTTNHAVPELPDATSCLKEPSSAPNLDKKQTDNFKEAIFSSLKNKHRRPDQWIYVSYDYVGTEPGDLTVQAGTVLRCLDPLPPPTNVNDVTIPERWLTCSTWYGQTGQVPSTFVRRILDPEELDGLLQYRPRAQALYDFTPQSEDDLLLKTGDILYLFESVDENWFRGESASTGQQGIFPVPFVRVIYPL